MGFLLTNNSLTLRINVLLVALLALVSIGHTQENPYQKVLEKLWVMQKRINELEDTVKSQQEKIKKLEIGLETPPSEQTSPVKVEPATNPAVLETQRTSLQEKSKKLEVGLEAPPSEQASPVKVEPATSPAVLETRLTSLKEELIETLTGDQSALDTAGFFDVTLQSPSERDRPFEFGAFELDLEYHPNTEHYAVSTALVWDGDMAEIAVGVLDYHWFDDSVPARGRIFNEPGLHVQVGRFDIPFGLDYQYFAAPDRPSVSAPLTTERLQLGGYNSDGIRLYGTINMFDYVFYAVDSLYGDSGGTIGGRIGFFPSQNVYRLHRFGGAHTLDLGFSYLQDMDDSDVNDQVYGVDLTLRYEMFLLMMEWMMRDSHRDVLGLNADTGGTVNLGERDETGFHVTLVTDLESLISYPLYFFSRFDAWEPDFDALLDEEDDSIQYRVRNIKRLTLGLGYNFTESVGLKFEFFDSLGQGTREPEFDDRGAIAQVVASF